MPAKVRHEEVHVLRRTADTLNGNPFSHNRTERRWPTLTDALESYFAPITTDRDRSDDPR